MPLELTKKKLKNLKKDFPILILLNLNYEHNKIEGFIDKVDKDLKNNYKQWGITMDNLSIRLTEENRVRYKFDLYFMMYAIKNVKKIWKNNKYNFNSWTYR